MNPARAAASPRRRDDTASRARLRLEPWPLDPAVGQLVLLDHHTVPTASDLARWIDRARREGYRAVRTGALFPRATDAVLELGFRPIDRLALLRRELPGPPVAVPSRRDDADDAADTGVRPLRRRHHDAAAEVDRAAFGDAWANDAASLARISRATPIHHSRRIGRRGEVVAFAISGAGGATGYLQRLAVHPRHQRAGLGHRLVVDALAWMRTRGLTTAMVNTGVDNAPALALYDALGFVRLPERLTIAELVLDRQVVDRAVADRAAPT